MHPIPSKRTRVSHPVFVAALLASTGSPAAAFLWPTLLVGLHGLER